MTFLSYIIKICFAAKGGSDHNVVLLLHDFLTAPPSGVDDQTFSLSQMSL